MKRTPLKERLLPDYNKLEDLANMITHIVGGSMGIVITVFAVLVSAIHRNIWGVVSGSIYGFTLIALFTMSSVYHGLKAGMAKKVFQVIDHCTIYFLIAGTYTPILLSGIRAKHPFTAWLIFGIEWGFALLGATLNAIDLKKYNIFSMICYIGMGWCVLAVLKPTIEALTVKGFLWLLAGGVSYTIGAILFVIGAKKRYYHSVFHIFVNLGSILQAISIIFYVL